MDVYDWEVLLDADEVGASAEFTATDGTGVLVDLHGSWRLACLAGMTDFPDERLSFWDFPDPSLKGVDVVDAGDDGELTGVIVLACDPTACSLLHAPCGRAVRPAQAAALSPVSAAEFPPGFVPSRLVIDRVGPNGQEGEWLCAFGNGLYCLVEDEWQSAIPSLGEAEVVDVHIGDTSVVLGPEGRWWKRSANGPWTAQPELEGEPTRIGQYGGSLVLVGEDGLWQIGADAAQACTSPFQLAVVLPMQESSSRIIGAAGETVLHRREEREGSWSCSLPSMALEGPILDATSVPCSLSLNWRLLTSSQLLGTNYCITSID